MVSALKASYSLLKIHVLSYYSIFLLINMEALKFLEFGLVVLLQDTLAIFSGFSN
jgi:hypothetical protein